jgi:hypothetical protein
MSFIHYTAISRKRITQYLVRTSRKLLNWRVWHPCEFTTTDIGDLEPTALIEGNPLDKFVPSEILLRVAMAAIVAPTTCEFAI